MRLRHGTHGGAVLETAQLTGLHPDAVLDFSNNADSLAAPLARRLLGALDYPFAYYPDTDCSELRQALAVHEQVPHQEILIGNGSSELIYLALQRLRPARVLLVGPIFLEYARACTAMNIPYALHALDPEEDFRLSAEELHVILDSLAGGRYDMLILCSPNNPTGQAYDLLEQLLRQAPCRTVILDAAYREFVWGTSAFQAHSHARLSSISQRGLDLISLHSFTKSFGVPGLRLGYALGPAPLLHELYKGRPPWMVSRYAEVAGITLLANIQSFRAFRNDLPQRRTHLRHLLAASGLFTEILPSQCNFLLAKLRNKDEGRSLYCWLAERGILVRICDDIPGMPQGYLRLQVRNSQENTLLSTTLRRYACSEERAKLVAENSFTSCCRPGE